MWEFATCQIWICKDNWFGGCQILLSKEKWKRCFKSGSIHPKNEDSRVQEIIPTFWDPTINNKRQKFSFLQWSGSHICPELTIFQNKSIKHLWHCYCSAQSSFFFSPVSKHSSQRNQMLILPLNLMTEFKTFFSVKILTPNLLFFFFFLSFRKWFTKQPQNWEEWSVFLAMYEDFPSCIDTFYLNHTLTVKQTISTVYSF